MKLFKTEIKWGIILAAVTFIVFLVSNILGWQTVETLSKHLSIAFGAFLIGNLGCLWLGLREKKRLTSNQTMSYLQGVKSGVIITIVAAIFGAAFLYFFTCCINAEFLQVTTEFNVAEGTFKDGEVMNAATFLTEFVTHSLVIGTVFTLILSFFSKSKTD